MRPFTLAAVFVLAAAGPARGVDLPGLVDQALEPVLTAAVAVAQGDRTTAAARAASVSGLVASALAASEDPAVAAALGRKAKSVRKRLARLGAAATRAAGVVGKAKTKPTAAMRVLRKVSRAGQKVVRTLAALPVPGVVLVETDARAAGFYHPGQTVMLQATTRDDAGAACPDPLAPTVVNLLGGSAVDPGATDLGGGQFRVVMGSTGGAARVELSACGRAAGRLLFNDAPPPGGGGGDTWTLEPIMAGSEVGHYPQIALDAAGGPHVVSLDRAGDAYAYSTRAGDTWSTEAISTAGQACGSNVGVLSDIALDSLGAPHVSLEIPDRAVQHGVRGGGWSVTDVSTILCPYGSVSMDQAYAFVGDNAIAVDRTTDTAWIVAWVYNGVAGRRAVGGWRTGAGTMMVLDEGTVGGDTATGRHPGIAVGTDGVGHVVYEGYTGSHVVRYTRWTGGGVTTSTIDGGSGNSGKSTAVAVDSTNRPHAVYLSDDGHQHAVWNGTGWNVDLLTGDTAAAGNAWVDVAIDASDTLHVVYSTTSGAVRYVRGKANSWTAPVTIAIDGDHPAIAVTAAGKPHVVFRDPLDDRLVHATR